MDQQSPRVLMLHSPDQSAQPSLGRLRAKGWEVVLTEPEDLERFHRALAPRLVLVPSSWDAERRKAWMATAPQTLLVTYGETPPGWPLHLAEGCEERELECLLELADALREGVERLHPGGCSCSHAEEELPCISAPDPHAALHRDLLRLLALADGADEAMLCIGADGRVAFCNPAAESLIGCGALGILGKPCSEVLPEWLAEGAHPPAVGGGEEWRRSICVEGLPGEIDLRARRVPEGAPNAGDRVIFLRLGPPADESAPRRRSTPVGCRPVGEREARAAAAEDPSNADWEHVHNVLRGGDRLEEWLALCSETADAGTSFSVSEALRGLRRSHSHRARQRGLKLSWSIPTGVGDVTLVGVAGYLRRALEELLDNALRFTPAGGEILFAVEPRSGGLHWRIENRESSLGAGEWERARGEFVRLADPLDGSPAGPGLGLPIAEECLQRLGSRLGAECLEGGRLVVGFWTGAPALVESLAASPTHHG